MFSMWARATLGGVLLQVKSLPWKTFVSSSMLSPVSECSTSVFSGCPWSPMSATSYRESISSSRSSSTASSWSSEPLSPISSLLCLSPLLSTLDHRSRNGLEIVQGRPFLFRHYSSILQHIITIKCTKINMEKQHAQGHLESNLTPGRVNRNFRRTVITNSTNQYADLEGTCRDKVTMVGVIVRYIKKKLSKKNEGWGQILPGWPYEG